jgi:uncharacterized protein YdaU (DUF1376 family)
MSKKKIETDFEKEFFKHRYHARSHLKLKKIIVEMGYEGLGLYWCLVEILYEAGGYIDKNSLKSLAFDLHTEEEKLIQILTAFKLFKEDGDRLFSEECITQLKYRVAKRKKAQKAAKAKHANAAKKSANAEHPQELPPASEEHSQDKIPANAGIIRGREEKEKEEEEEIIKIDSVVGSVLPPTVKKSIDERAKEFAEQLIPFAEKYERPMLVEFYNYWTEHSAKGKKMRFEKQTVFDVTKRLVTWKLNLDQKFKKAEKPNAYKPGQFVQ